MGKASRRKRERKTPTPFAGPPSRGRVARGTMPLREAAGTFDPVHGWSPPTVGGNMAFPMGPNEDSDLHMENLAIPVKTFMGTPMIVNLSVLAREQAWCTKALDESMLRRLDPMGHHLISVAWKHTTQDFKRENV